MTQETLAWLGARLEEAGLPYQFMRWEDEPPECYFVGEYLESPSMTLEENGYQETTFLLRLKSIKINLTIKEWKV